MIWSAAGSTCEYLKPSMNCWCEVRLKQVAPCSDPGGWHSIGLSTRMPTNWQINSFKLIFIRNCSLLLIHSFSTFFNLIDLFKWEWQTHIVGGGTEKNLSLKTWDRDWEDSIFIGLKGLKLCFHFYMFRVSSCMLQPNKSTQQKWILLGIPLRHPVAKIFVENRWL